MNNQRIRKTIGSPVSINGVGLHSGAIVQLDFYPAEAHTGIVFTRSKDFPNDAVEAVVANVINTSLAVTLGNGKWYVQTVEHLLSALHMLEISDIVIDTSGSEIPVLDGSALPYVHLLQQANIVEHKDEYIEIIEIKNPLWVMDGDKYIIGLPASQFQVTYNIHFNHPMLRSQSFHSNINEIIFEAEIAPARTFGFLEEVAYLRAKGLAKGGSMENAIVLDNKGYLNPSLRFEDECVRHKVLDMIGDLSLVGYPLRGHFIANKAGHALDVAIAKKILKLVVENNELELLRKKKKSTVKFAIQNFLNRRSS